MTFGVPDAPGGGDSNPNPETSDGSRVSETALTTSTQSRCDLHSPDERAKVSRETGPGCPRPWAEVGVRNSARLPC